LEAQRQAEIGGGGAGSLCAQRQRDGHDRHLEEARQSTMWSDWPEGQNPLEQSDQRRSVIDARPTPTDKFSIALFSLAISMEMAAVLAAEHPYVRSDAIPVSSC
jgi:hypothetical protein